MSDFKKTDGKLEETIKVNHSRAILENEMLMLNARDAQLHKEMDVIQLKLDKCDELGVTS